MGIPIKNKQRYGLIGNPLGHSISPFIHNELQKSAGIVGEYGLFEIREDRLESEFEKTLKKLNGFNVTIPYKTEIISRLDSLSSRALLFGAVNTVDIKNGRAKGYNTDCEGFIKSLYGAGIELKGTVLVLGCGGAARMFAFESALAGARVTVAARGKSMAKAQKLCDEIKDKLDKASEIICINNICTGYDLIINATPVGMFPAVDACPVSEDIIKKSGAVFDAIYNPLETKLLSLAKKHGVKCVNGLPMLVWQAAVAEQIWNGSEFSDKVIESVIKKSEEYLTR